MFYHNAKCQKRNEMEQKVGSKRRREKKFDMCILRRGIFEKSTLSKLGGKKLMAEDLLGDGGRRENFLKFLPAN